MLDFGKKNSSFLKKNASQMSLTVRCVRFAVDWQLPKKTKGSKQTAQGVARREVHAAAHC
jgi:hypothetical protein